MDNLPQRIAMPCPFAGGDGASFTEPVNGSSESNMNWQKGFGSNYSAPASNGGKYVTRAEMNGLGKVATQDIFYHKCGGINTFDSEFATAIGGYPKGAVLDYVFGSKIMQVMSLVPNNTIDFNAVGVDGENWIALNRDEASIEDGKIVIGSLSQNFASNEFITYLGEVTAPMSGYINLADVELGGGKTLQTSHVYTNQSAGDRTLDTFFSSMAIAVKKLGTSGGTLSDITPYPTVSNMNSWTIIPTPVGSLYKEALHTKFTISNYVASIDSVYFSNSGSVSMKPFSVSKNDVIAFCIIFGTNGIASVSASSVTSSSCTLTATVQHSALSSIKAKVVIS